LNSARFRRAGSCAAAEAAQHAGHHRLTSARCREQHGPAIHRERARAHAKSSWRSRRQIPAHRARRSLLGAVL
jgi:hypothetical protein